MNLYRVDVTSRKARRIGSWPSIPAAAGPPRFIRFAFSPRGDRIAVAVATAAPGGVVPAGQRLILVDADTGRTVWQRRYPLRPGQAEVQARFNAGGTLVTSAAQGETLIWNARTGRIERRFPVGGPFALAPDGRTAAVGQNSPDPSDPRTSLATLDLRTGKRRSLQAVPAQAWITSVAFTPDGAGVTAASFEGAVRVWDLAAGRIVQTFTGQPSGLNLAVGAGGPCWSRDRRAGAWRPGISPGRGAWDGRSGGTPRSWAAPPSRASWSLRAAR